MVSRTWVLKPIGILLKTEGLKRLFL